MGVFITKFTSGSSPSSTGNTKISIAIIQFMVFLCSSTFFVTAIKCVCNPQECDIIRPEDCPGKGYIVWDPCKCCKVCARTLGEACGGPGGFSGTCEPPLKCVIKPPIIGTGVCVDIPDSLDERDSSEDCAETISIEAGCDIVNRRCKCWEKMQVCQHHKMRWDFKNLEECELNLQNVVKNELEFDEDYTIPPQNFEYKMGKSKRRKLSKKKRKDHDCTLHPCN